MESRRLMLATKPGASLAISTTNRNELTKASAPLDKTLIVFLNGLVSTQATWEATIEQFLARDRDYFPVLLTYDRFGQGASDPDPSDPPNTPYGHDAAAVIDDLHQLLSQVCPDNLYLSAPGIGSDTDLILVCNSIGCPLARLYAAAHPGTVTALLFLDSMMANSDFVSIFPDPDANNFKPDELPKGVSIEDLRHSREQYREYFHPTVGNPERFDRRDMAQRLPFADQPPLPMGKDGKGPFLTVVGHDFDKFAQDGLNVSQTVHSTWKSLTVSRAS